MPKSYSLPPNLVEVIGKVIVGYENHYFSHGADDLDDDDTIRVRDILPARAIKRLSEDIPTYLREKWMPIP